VLVLGIAVLLSQTATAGTAGPPPRVTDFEVRVPAPRAAASSAAAPTITVRPGRRFSVFGMRWRGPHARKLTVRVRDARTGWRPWVEVPADRDDAPDVGSDERARQGWNLSDPVWAGDAVTVQYRLRAPGAVRTPTLHFVDTHAAASSARSSAAPRAAGGPPALVTRDGWGAQQCPPRATPAYGRVQFAFVHHTVSANTYGPQDSAAMVLGICRYHRNSNGWNDIGYNFLVDRYGTIFEGRAGGIDQAVIGAQAQGYNTESTGVAALGTFNTDALPQPGLDAIARLLAWKLGIHGVPPTGTVGIVSGGGSLNRYPAGRTVQFQRISGHRDGDATSCPGNALYNQLPGLRLQVAALPRPAVASVSLAPTRRRITYPEKVELFGALAGPNGAGLGGRSVAIQFAKRTGRWATLHSVKTDIAGTYRTRVRLSYNRNVRAYFAGEPGAGTTGSVPVSVGVRPQVTATVGATGEGVSPGDRIAIRGRVRPVKRTVLLLAERRSRGTYRRVVRRVVRARGGRVKTSFRFARTGAYRFRLAVLRDARNLAARSPATDVNVTAAATPPEPPAG
jgi:N-acetylmuramoyl-L-alanine amidase